MRAVAAAPANSGFRSCAQRRRSCQLRATLWSCVAKGGPCTSGKCCRCIQAQGEEGNVALAWPAFRTRIGGRVRNSGSSAKGERFDMNFGMVASAKGAWFLNAKSDYGSCWSVNGIPGGYCRGTYFVSLPVRRGCIRDERECSRRRLASNALLACRRFKRRACCADRGTAHCNRLNRLQSSRSLHSYRLFSAAHCLSSFMFFQQARH